MFIQTEVMPDPTRMKFYPGETVLPSGMVEFRDEEDAERSPLDEACMQHLRAVIDLLKPEVLVGIGVFAAKRLELARQHMHSPDAYRVIQILHPSPASPAANRGWEAAIEKQLAQS